MAIFVHLHPIATATGSVDWPKAENEVNEAVRYLEKTGAHVIGVSMHSHTHAHGISWPVFVITYEADNPIPIP